MASRSRQGTRATRKRAVVSASRGHRPYDRDTRSEVVTPASLAARPTNLSSGGASPPAQGLLPSCRPGEVRDDGAGADSQDGTGQRGGGIGDMSRRRAPEEARHGFLRNERCQPAGDEERRHEGRSDTRRSVVRRRNYCGVVPGRFLTEPRAEPLRGRLRSIPPPHTPGRGSIPRGRSAGR